MANPNKSMDLTATMESIVNKFKVRDATIDDIKEIIEVDKTTGGNYPNLESKLREMIGNDFFLVALFEDNIVGYSGGVIRHTEFGESDPIGYVTHIALKADFAKKGMGKMLGDKLVDEMSTHCRRIRTLLDFKYVQLQSYFSQIGFQKTETMVYEFSEENEIIYP